MNNFFLQIKNVIKSFISPKVNRPWGNYEVLAEGANYQIKRIEVNVGASLSLQMHHRRAEHWTVLSGLAEVTLDENIFTLKEMESIDIPLKAKHRLVNAGQTQLFIIEVQNGDYLGEDDIVRFSDIYGRV